MMRRTIVPRARNVQRVGYAKELFRIVTVDLFTATSCTGAPLHLAHGVSFVDGQPAAWFVSHVEAKGYGWIE